MGETLLTRVEMAYIGNTERLCHAIVDHDLEAVKDWLRTGDPNSRDYTGRAPLHLACMTSSPEIVQCLVDHGARLTARIADGRTSLHIAAARGSVAMVRILLHKSEENEAEEDRKTELRKAKTEQAVDGDIEISHMDDASSTTESFVQVEKDPESADAAEKIPEDEGELGPDIYDVNVVSWDSRTSPLHLAILHGHIDVMEELVSSFGAEVLLPIKLLKTYDNSPRAAILTLVLALRLPLEQAKEMTAKLLQLGAMPTQADLDQNTPLHYIAATSFHELIDIFLNYNRPATEKALNHICTNGRSWNPDMYSTLMVSIAAKDTVSSIKLLEHGAAPFITYENWFKSAVATMPSYRRSQTDWNMRMFRQDMKQPVIQAVEEELPNVVLEILKRGADPNILHPIGYEVRDDEYRRDYQVGMALLDTVRDKLKKLRECKNEAPDFRTPRQLEPEKVYLDGLEEGSYKMWVAKEQLQDADFEYKKEQKSYADRIRQLKEKKGVQEKEAALNHLIQGFETVERTLLNMKAKTFREMYPEIEEPKQGEYSPSPYRPEPFKLKFDFHVPDLTDEKREGYFKLYVAPSLSGCSSDFVGSRQFGEVIFRRLRRLRWECGVRITNSSLSRSPPLM